MISTVQLSSWISFSLFALVLLSLGFGYKPFDLYQNMLWNSCLGDDLLLEVCCLVLCTK